MFFFKFSNFQFFKSLYVPRKYYIFKNTKRSGPLANCYFKEKNRELIPEFVTWSLDLSICPLSIFFSEFMLKHAVSPPQFTKNICSIHQETTLAQNISTGYIIISRFCMFLHYKAQQRGLNTVAHWVYADWQRNKRAGVLL